MAENIELSDDDIGSESDRGLTIFLLVIVAFFMYLDVSIYLFVVGFHIGPLIVFLAAWTGYRRRYRRRIDTLEMQLARALGR